LFATVFRFHFAGDAFRVRACFEICPHLRVLVFGGQPEPRHIIAELPAAERLRDDRGVNAVPPRAERFDFVERKPFRELLRGEFV
jgi:hypothetical protein